ncbi:hypothetical protein OG453_37350 [Streptomyces sp. NBC_01381]|uniref:hypothetical protein n=1 Tax=Streptomyces sp. NBC_01381 TaxID=2903845 RepID=UPI002251CA0C|nr:hypothetical protein [Streptomyces sp. NBC_01381]MCX4672269.1 hypothetical protein [Streptomyces sp. NBC_01381]
MLRKGHGLAAATAGLLAARGVYGCIVVLSLLLALEDHPPPAFETALVLATTLTGIVAAEAFASLIGQEVERGRPPTWGERRRTAAERSTAFSAAVAPILFFVLAGFGLFAERLAFTLSRWVTLILLFVFCCAARGLSGRTRTNALLTGFVAAALGVVLANFKSLTHG